MEKGYVQIKFSIFIKRAKRKIRDQVNIRQTRRWLLISQRKAGGHVPNARVCEVCQNQYKDDWRICILWCDLEKVAVKSMRCALKKRKFTEIFSCLKGNSFRLNHTFFSILPHTTKAKDSLDIVEWNSKMEILMYTETNNGMHNHSKCKWNVFTLQRIFCIHALLDDAFKSKSQRGKFSKLGNSSKHLIDSKALWRRMMNGIHVDFMGWKNGLYTFRCSSQKKQKTKRYFDGKSNWKCVRVCMSTDSKMISLNFIYRKWENGLFFLIGKTNVCIYTSGLNYTI